MLLTTNTTIDKITSYVRQMSDEEQKAVLMAFEKKDMMEKAKRLNKSVNKKIKVTTQEIVAEIDKIRMENTHLFQ